MGKNCARGLEYGLEYEQTLTTSRHSIEFTYSDFPYHFKVKSD